MPLPLRLECQRWLRDIPLAQYYQGNAYADDIGVDANDEAPIPLPPIGSATRWPALLEEPLGLSQIAAFAASHDKPLSIPEWVTMSSHGGDGAYVDEMGEFIATHDVAYQCCFDAGDNQVLPVQREAGPPRWVNAYLKWFSPRARPTRAAHRRA